MDKKLINLTVYVNQNVDSESFLAEIKADPQLDGNL